jgi:predicted lactoylglutathione lyase
VSDAAGDDRFRQELSRVLDQPARRHGAGRAGSGVHICLRAKSTGDVDAFHAAALSAGGRSDGAPGLRPHDRVRYYAAFVIDPDGNRIEAVTFPKDDAETCSRSR